MIIRAISCFFFTMGCSANKYLSVFLFCRFFLIVIILISGYRDIFSQCPMSVGRNPGTMADDASIGSRVWNSPNNAASSNDNYAWSGAIVLGDRTHYLFSTNFGFTIPSTAVICGITVRFEKRFSGLFGNISDNSIRLVSGGTVVGSDLATGATWPNSDAYVVHGGSSNLWGRTWTPADINNSGFGVAISANLGGTFLLPVAYIDHVRITIHYDESLPVNLISFTAGCKKEGINLEWITASEVNCDYFEIQRSADGFNWEMIGKITGNGTTSSVSKYVFTDPSPFDGITYYRLKQFDFDGTEYFLPVVGIRTGCFQRNDELKIYPNPVSDILHVNYKAITQIELSLELFNQNGQVVKTLSLDSQPGENQFKIDVSGLQSNTIYTITITGNDRRQSAQFLK